MAVFVMSPSASAAESDQWKVISEPERFGAADLLSQGLLIRAWRSWRS